MSVVTDAINEIISEMISMKDTIDANVQKLTRLRDFLGETT